MNNTILWYTTRGAGTITLILLTLVVVLGVMSVARPASERWPRFLSTGLHRNLALMSLIFLSIHVITAVVDPFTHLGWLTVLVPFASSYRTFWLGLGTIAFDLLLAVAITSWVRNFIGHGAWRAVHWLTYAAWPIGVLHGFGTGTDAFSLLFSGIAWACCLTVAYAVVYRLRKGTSNPLPWARESFAVSAQTRGEK